MSLDLFDDKSTFVQVLAWCHQAASHYLSQCWPRSMSPHSITRPQRINAGWDNDLMPDSTKPLPLPMTNHKLLRLSATCFIEIVTKIPTLLFKKQIWKCCLQNGSHVDQAWTCHQTGTYYLHHTLHTLLYVLYLQQVNRFLVTCYFIYSSFPPLGRVNIGWNTWPFPN